MKPIELTKEHCEKLLEMCGVLFPFEDFHTIDDNGMLLGTHGQSTDGVSIHWFEFCTTHLVKKLIFNKKKNPKKQHDSFKEFFYLVNNYFIQTIQHEHPIDYLYKEFKKNK